MTSPSSATSRQTPVCQMNPRPFGLSASLSAVIAAIVGLVGLVFLPWQAALLLGGGTFGLTLLSQCCRGSGNPAPSRLDATYAWYSLFSSANRNRTQTAPTRTLFDTQRDYQLILANSRDIPSSRVGVGRGHEIPAHVRFQSPVATSFQQYPNQRVRKGGGHFQ